MSGIYLPGMEIPKGCAFCKISRRNGKKMICPFIWKCEWDIHDPMSADHRLDGCPLVPARAIIEAIPADDVQPVRHGRWIDKPGGTYRRMQSWCSVCGKRNGIGGIESNRHKPYCPNCGAKMDEEKE